MTASAPDLAAFERDPYLTRLEVEVLRVGEDGGRSWAVLDDTLLYPEGGGQPADHGRLDGVAVIDTVREGGEIRHYLERPCQPGPARLELDWPRRYDHMQQHTAQHLLSALALESFGWATRSFHLGAETSDIELDAAELGTEQLAALEEAALTEIVTGRPIRTRRVTPAEYEKLEVRSRGLPAGHSGDIRLVEIEGVDLNTCGGTHLRSTSEIEAIKLLHTERLRGGTRVHWVAGRRLRRRLGGRERLAAELRRLFDSDDAGLVEIAALKLEKLAASRRRERHLEDQLADARVELLARSGGPLVSAHFDDADGGFLRRLGRKLVGLAPEKAALLTATSESGSFFLLAAGDRCGLDAAALGPSVAALLDGRGGGSRGLFQGKAGSLAGRDEAEALVGRELDAARGQTPR